MRARIFSALALCVLGCFAVRVLAQEESDAATIRALESKRVDASTQRQIVTARRRLRHPCGGWQPGRQGWRHQLLAGSLRVDMAEVSDLKVRMHDTIAAVTGLITSGASLAESPTTITTG